MTIEVADRIKDVQEYYFSKKLQEIDQMRKSGLDVINLGIGSPDMAPSEQTINRLIEGCSQPENHGYQPYRGIPELRHAFSNWYLRYFHVNVHPDNEVLPLMGSKEGIMHISLAFLNPGDEVLVPNPGYPTYAAASRLAGANIRYYGLSASNDWYPELDQLENEGLEKVKLMWVNYPHMPSGKKASRSVFEKLVAFGEKNGILICNDNPYSFILNKKPMSLLSVWGAKSIALELNSLSKSHNMAGWRVGMVAGHSDYINAILKVKSNMDSGMFKPLQMAAIQALESHETWYDLINKEYGIRRRLAVEIMDVLDCQYDSDQVGMFVWGKIPDFYESAIELSDKLLHQAHVFVTPGMIFGSNGARYLRISLCSNRKRLSESKRRIRAIM